MNMEKMKKDIGKILDEAQDKAGDFRESVEDKIDDAKYKAMDMRRKTNRYVANNPEKSLLISALVGAAIAIALFKSSKKKEKCDHY